MPAAAHGDIFASLNKAQCRAVSSAASTVAILAGPGSGKTHTLTSRVVWLIDHAKIQPCDIIVATFTVKASNEMKSRMGQALGDGRERKIVLGTFHSIARRYLAAYGKHIGLKQNFAIADDSDSRGIIQRICKRLAVPLEPAMARAWISKRKAKGTSDDKTILSKTGKAVESQALEQCFQEYQSHLERSNLLDYDDLLVRCVELLQRLPSCVSNIQAVLVDEYQDTNGVQYDLMKLLAQRSRMVTIVGDPDQSGFKFYERAEIKMILDYLRIVHQPDNNDALARIINVPKRGIGDQTIKTLLEEAERNSMSLWKLLVQHCRGVRTAKTNIRKQTEQKLNVELIRLIEGVRGRLRSNDGTPINLVEVIEKLIHDLHVQSFLEETYAEHGSRWANVQEFVNLAAEFMRDKSRLEEETLPPIEGVQQSSDDDILARFLANISLASDKQTDDKDADGRPLVTISTIHAAKGLEWPVVFIPAVYQGSIPHMRSDDDAEERRLLYVAMTRAQALLYLSLPLYISNGNGDGAQLSPFIECISLSNFLKKGPSLDRHVMVEIAKILRREVPSEHFIYQNMPLGTSVEDNQFPVDPKQPDINTNGGSAIQPTALHKRRKLQHTGGTSQIAAESAEGWCTPYATTMQKSDSFTLPQPAQTGFTTAAAHHASAATAAATEEPKPSAKPASRAQKPPAAGGQRPVQRSLLGYGYGITNHDNSKIPDVQDLAPPPSRPIQNAAYPPRHRPPWSNRPRGQQLPAPAKPQPAPAIDPGLASHKLGSAKFTTKPTQNRAGEEKQASKPYACFSSSPSKPPPEGPDGAEKENIVPPEEIVRPAASFYATTVNGALGGRRGGGIKRPAPLPGLGRSGIAPMDQLKKPFKLTVKRP
ncbi:ATP-dependent DNA helicase srs2 [Diatrype stigma]|uniref:DNA 3'-5' helicase n=1 Tax=Diatrype stigma TaxID=117547 RepID=A0AAN9YQH3_9PEZI